MMDDLRFYALSNSIAVISGRWEIYNERMCATETPFTVEKILHRAGVELGNAWSVGQRLTHWATGDPLLQKQSVSFKENSYFERLCGQDKQIWTRLSLHKCTESTRNIIISPLKSLHHMSQGRKYGAPTRTHTKVSRLPCVRALYQSIFRPMKSIFNNFCLTLIWFVPKIFRYHNR